MGALRGVGFFPFRSLLPQLRQCLFQVDICRAVLDGEVFGQFCPQFLAGLPIRGKFLVVSRDAAVDHTLGDIPLQQKPLDVLVAARRVKRPAQGLVPANTRDLRVYIRPIRVTLAKQLPCRGVRRKQGQIPLAGIRMVRNVPTELPLGGIKGQIEPCQAVRGGQRRFVYGFPLHYQPGGKIQKAVV